MNIPYTFLVGGLHNKSPGKAYDFFIYICKKETDLTKMIEEYEVSA